MPVLNHQYATVLSNGDILLKTSANRHTEVFCAQQARLYLMFDAALRSEEDPYDPETAPVPGGYDEFVFAWNLDTICPYSFATYSPDTDTIALDALKEPVPASLLIPTLSNGEAEDDEAMSVKDRRLLQVLLKAAAEREVRQREKARESYQDRKKRRDDSSRRQLYSKGMASLTTSLESGLGRAPRRSLSTRARSASPTPTASSSASRDIYLSNEGSQHAPNIPPTFTVTVTSTPNSSTLSITDTVPTAPTAESSDAAQDEEMAESSTEVNTDVLSA